MELNEPAITRVQVPPVIHSDSLQYLIDHFREAADDERTRVIVLVGSAESFCRGLDLHALLTDRSQEPEDDTARLTAATAGFARLLQDIRFAPRPVIAAVEGCAIGGGVGLVAACDIVLATQAATFALPELLLGLLPATILPLLLERMPAQKVRRLALLAESCPAAEARDLGLVDQVVPADGLERALRRTIRALLRLDPSAVGTLKQYSAEVTREGLAEALQRGAAMTANSLGDPAGKARIRAFLDEGVPWAAA